MDPLSHLFVLTSIIVGLGIAELLGGTARLIQLRHTAKPDWVHLIWIFNVFILFLINWWMALRWEGEQVWTFYQFFFLLLYPTLLYLQSVLLFTRDIPDGFNAWLHFLANRQWFFAIAILLIFVDWSDAFLKGPERMADLGLFYWFCTALLLCLFCVAFFSKNRRFHAIFVVFFCIVHLYWLYYAPTARLSS